MRLRHLALLAPLALCSAVPAQWLNYPTPGIPRTADGKPNLSAPAPHTADGKPDFSGLWRHQPSTSGETDKAMQTIQAQPWAEELSKKRRENLGRDNMSVLCLPSGPRADDGVGKIIQTPGILLMLFSDLTYRQVFLDGRSLPDDPNPDWMGYSIGHWDKDTLVIESAGFNDRTWLDDDGHPHSEALRVTERLRRPDFGHLVLERTLDDPKALTQRLVIPLQFEFDADTEALEYVCAENERDRGHLVGTASDDKKNAVQLPVEILKQYVGSYEMIVPESRPPRIPLDIALEAGQLTLSMNGGAKYPLTALSETKFYFEGTHLEVEKGPNNTVLGLVLRGVEGDYKAPRKP
jgi:hypothetical protein